MLKTKHNKTAGFFSNCTVLLTQIIKFFVKNKKLPSSIDSSSQFCNYKKNENDIKEDLTKYFFEEQTTFESDFEECHFNVNAQFQKYKDINFKSIIPYVYRFFSPSKIVKDIIQTLEEKYTLDYENLCSVYYRGNDKTTETLIADYKEFFKKAEEILQKNCNLRFLIQTDEIEFCTEFKKKFPNSLFFEELSMINHDPSSSIHYSIPRGNRKEHASYFLAAIIIVSKTKHVITYSGNCGLWAILYRGNAKNVHQYLVRKNRITNKITRNYGWIE